MDNRAMLQKSLDYIDENLRTQITAQELADMTHFSLFHYYRLFQQATGLPVMQYILRRRLLHRIYSINRIDITRVARQGLVKLLCCRRPAGGKQLSTGQLH